MHRGVTGTLVFSCNDFFWSMCCPLAGATDGKIVQSASFTCTHIMQSIYKAKERGLFKSMEIIEYFFTFLNSLLNVNLKQTFKFACKSKLINMFLGFVFCLFALEHLQKHWCLRKEVQYNCKFSCILQSSVFQTCWNSSYINP